MMRKEREKKRLLRRIFNWAQFHRLMCFLNSKLWFVDECVYDFHAQVLFMWVQELKENSSNDEKYTNLYIFMWKIGPWFSYLFEMNTWKCTMSAYFTRHIGMHLCSMEQCARKSYPSSRGANGMNTHSSECNHSYAFYIFIFLLIFHLVVSALPHLRLGNRTFRMLHKICGQSYCCHRRYHCCCCYRSQNVDVFSRWSMHTIRNALEHICVLGMSSRCRSLAVNSCPVSTCLCNVSKAHY